uniref:Capsid protein n=1 Tax=Hainan gekko similignum astrovirus TaxID=2116329 RepID=A0A2P1GND0_9VIRU|nr:capsid protein [Hainan gekko similignum astrovirus]
MSAVRETVQLTSNEPKQQRRGRARSRSRSRGRSKSRGRSRSRSRGRSNRMPIGTLATSVRGGGRQGASVTETIRVTQGDNSGPRGRGRGRGRGRWIRGRGRGLIGALNREQREINALKKKTDGPKVAKYMNGTLTIGVVSGNASQSEIQRKYHVMLHPCLLKDANTAGSLTPLSDTAKDYSLWRCVKAHVRLVPLVNASVVSGSFCIQSLDQNAESAKAVNIDDLTTRPYNETQLGERSEWRVNSRLLEGQRQGWWICDTNEDPSLCSGPAIDVHVYGRTFDLLNTSSSILPSYDGPLWLCQLVYGFQFANWEPKPGMGTLDVETVNATDVTITTNANGELVAEVTETTGKLHMLTTKHDKDVYRTGRAKSFKSVAGAENLGTTIFQVVSGAAEAIASAVPGPWSWLIKGGLWFARRLFGQGSNDDNIQFVLYPDLSQAQRDNRITDANLPGPISFGPDDHLGVTQYNTTNVQYNTATGGGEPTTIPSFPFGPGVLMENPLKMSDGTVLTKVQSWSATCFGGFSMNINTSRPTRTLLAAFDQVKILTHELVELRTGTQQYLEVEIYSNQFGAVDGTSQWKSFDGTWINSNTPTGTVILEPHHGGLYGDKPNYSRGVLGNGHSIINFLGSQPSSVNYIGGFYKVKGISAIQNDGAGSGPMPVGYYPKWVDFASTTLWVCSVDVGNNHHYFEDTGFIFVDTQKRNIGYWTWRPNGIYAEGEKAGQVMPGNGNPSVSASVEANLVSNWYILTNNLRAPAKKREVTFRDYIDDDVLYNDPGDGFNSDCECEGACACGSSFEQVNSDNDDYNPLIGSKPLTTSEMESMIKGLQQMILKKKDSE